MHPIHTTAPIPSLHVPLCSELHFCNGLAFTFVRKVGAGISFESGHGFVIRKIITGAHCALLYRPAGCRCTAALQPLLFSGVAHCSPLASDPNA